MGGLVDVRIRSADIHGHGNNVKKFEGYKVLASQAPNTLTMADKTRHAGRRRILSQAFSENSLRIFEPSISSRIDRFCDIIRENGATSEEWTRPLDMAHHCRVFTAW